MMNLTYEASDRSDSCGFCRGDVFPQFYGDEASEFQPVSERMKGFRVGADEGLDVLFAAQVFTTPGRDGRQKGVTMHGHNAPTVQTHHLEFDVRIVVPCKFDGFDASGKAALSQLVAQS